MNIGKVISIDWRRILPGKVKKVLREGLGRLQIIIWNKRGQPSPPPHAVKLQVIKKYFNKGRITTFIETGTFMGDTVEEMKGIAGKIYSIELDEFLYLRAKKFFSSAKNVTILQGDSGVVIERLLKDITKPALFWLDAHYSGTGTARGRKDTPIARELKDMGFNKIISMAEEVW